VIPHPNCKKHVQKVPRLTQKITCPHEYLKQGLTRLNDVFREHSENIEGTFREHSGNIQGTLREHSERVERTPVSLHPNCKKHSKYQG
jgi:hypothetical protein